MFPFSLVGAVVLPGDPARRGEVSEIVEAMLVEERVNRLQRAGDACRFRVGLNRSSYNPLASFSGGTIAVIEEGGKLVACYRMRTWRSFVVGVLFTTILLAAVAAVWLRPDGVVASLLLGVAVVGLVAVLSVTVYFVEKIRFPAWLQHGVKRRLCSTPTRRKAA